MINNISNLGTALSKEEQQVINGGGYGTVTCADGTTFSATAASYNSVVQGGNRWCKDHGHGSGASYFFVGDLK
ncbi:hypothetical protein [Tenacibaculum aiptasiae]|uniref:hypothetical protein n=1 Tax=Tenacibaculum aiptasiae TaxID=426481 RepID=UPI00232D0885|nr:hypothetical protein [Tenacibaculum aiptasiae]